MGRVEKFKELREFQRKRLLIGFLALGLLISGISMADYALNSLIRNQKHVSFFSIQDANNNCTEISLLNEKIYVDRNIFIRELDGIREMGRKILGF